MDIKKKIKASKVTQWEIAERIGVTEWTLSRYLRRPDELDPEIVKRIDNAIDELVEVMRRD